MFSLNFLLTTAILYWNSSPLVLCWSALGDLGDFEYLMLPSFPWFCVLSGGRRYLVKIQFKYSDMRICIDSCITPLLQILYIYAFFVYLFACLPYQYQLWHFKCKTEGHQVSGLHSISFLAHRHSLKLQFWVRNSFHLLPVHDGGISRKFSWQVRDLRDHTFGCAFIHALS